MDEKINLNDVASEVTRIEGGRKIQNVGDAKELLRIIFMRYSLQDIIRIWMKFHKVKL